MKIANMHRGLSDVADYQTPSGFCSEFRNLRPDIGTGIVRRHGTRLVRNLTSLDATKPYQFHWLDDYLIVIGEDPDNEPNLRPWVFGPDGTEVTIRETGQFTYDSGSTEISISDEITDDTSGATAVVLGVTVESGGWGTSDAAGTIWYRKTSSSSFGNGNTINSSSATLTSAESNVDYSYLGSDVSKIRVVVREQSVYVLNIEQVVGTLTAPSGTITGRKRDYDKLLTLYSAVAGDIYETRQSAVSNPVGFYQCVEAGNSEDETPPIWVRIPKPGQEDALYDPDTMPHRLIRLEEEDPVEFIWEQPEWGPRLSGGDIEGKDIYGRDIIRNAATLKDKKIRAFNFFLGRFALLLSSRQMVLSTAGNAFSFWLDDVSQTIASDRIVDEITGDDIGEPLWLEQVSSALMVIAENAQLQYSARDEMLSAGGTDTPYNGRFDQVSTFAAADIRPASSGPLGFYPDAKRRLHMVRLSDPVSGLQYAGEVSESIHSFLKEVQVVLIRVIDDTAYVIVDDGSVYVARATGVSENGLPVYSWGTMDFDEEVRFLWGYANKVRIVTEYNGNLSILTYDDEDPPIESGFTYTPRLDRMETISGTLNAQFGTTAFDLQTICRPSTHRVVSRSALNGFVPGEPIKPIASGIAFDTGTSEIARGDIITGAASGATGRVVRVDIDSGTWGGGDAAGVIYYDPTSDADFSPSETIEVNEAGAATSTSGPTRLLINRDLSSGSHYVGRLFTSRWSSPKLWGGVSRQRIVLRRLAVFHHKTSDYHVRIERSGRDDKTFRMTAKRHGIAKHGGSSIETGMFDARAGSNGREMVIHIESSTSGAFGVSAINAEYMQGRL